MTKRSAWACIMLFGCSLVLSGCAAKSPPEIKKADPPQVIEPKPIETVQEKDPCETLLDEMVEKSRKTMKTVKDSCKGVKMEVNPMWDMDYDGTVHIRIFDETDKMVRDELKKP